MPAVELPPAVEAERRELTGRSGRLGRYARRSRRVYAPDLPGYGFSDRSARRYDMALFCDAVRERPNWRVQSFDTGALVHFEQPGPFFASWDAFLARPVPPRRQEST